MKINKQHMKEKSAKYAVDLFFEEVNIYEAWETTKKTEKTWTLLYESWVYISLTTLPKPGKRHGDVIPFSSSPQPPLK